MSAHPIQMLDPVFRFLDDLISDYGHFIYMGLVYAAIPLFAWILFGGSRRKSSAGQSPAPRFVVIHQPANRRQPEEDFNPFPTPREQPDWPDDDDWHRD